MQPSRRSGAAIFVASDLVRRQLNCTASRLRPIDTVTLTTGEDEPARLGQDLLYGTHLVVVT